MNRFSQILTFIIETKLWIPMSMAILLVLFTFFLLFQMLRGQTHPPQQISEQPTITPILTQAPFSVVSTTPKDNETNILPGEIFISFTTDQSVLSPKDFSMSISPSLPYSWQFTNSYPTNTVTAQVLGGLQQNTTYTVFVKNKADKVVSQWSFTTSDQQPKSSSQLEKVRETENIKNDAPLFAYVPYDSPDFHIDYTDILTLEVDVKNPDLDKVKQEVNDWIRSHGVDPATHTIYYVTDYTPTQ